MKCKVAVVKVEEDGQGEKNEKEDEENCLQVEVEQQALLLL